MWEEWALPFTQSTEFWVVSFSTPSGLDGMKENKRGEKLVRQEMQTGILTRTDEYVKSEGTEEGEAVTNIP